LIKLEDPEETEETHIDHQTEDKDEVVAFEKEDQEEEGDDFDETLKDCEDAMVNLKNSSVVDNDSLDVEAQSQLEQARKHAEESLQKLSAISNEILKQLNDAQLLEQLKQAVEEANSKFFFLKQNLISKSLENKNNSEYRKKQI